MMKTLIFTISLFFAATASTAFAEDLVYTPVFNNRAIGGYDAVTYFSDSGPQKGSKKFRTQYQGAEWRFINQENLDLFLTAPTKYAPQYGGYCAWAVSQGYTAKGDPQQWHIDRGKLYLNYNAEIKHKWLADKENFIIDANQFWPGLLE